ncbi:HEPN domain-containing protein [Victivallis vadensis]|uniref:HEPN domain-containing protein n=1 Tax=Victivallis vadensis TaxID=172901 RepID=UPI002596DDFC|nr:HEPN domain-containing protein [uncultured Victivallis sp.]
MEGFNKDFDGFVKIAEQNFESYSLLMKGNKRNAAVTRLYYASFQLLYRRLYLDGQICGKLQDVHKQVIDLANYRRLIKPEQRKMLRELKDLRVKADYDGFELTREECYSPVANGEKLYAELKSSCI